MPQNHTARPRHAIVVGGSMVGAAIAAVLADRFERVTIIERDSLPVAPQTRAGVPQARHVHVLLTRGATELERLLPGVLDEMVAAGAQRIDVGRDVAWLTPAGWGMPFDSGFSLCCATRDLIEWHTRRRVLQLPNVEAIDGASVIGLVANTDCSRVHGVYVRRRRDDGAAHTEELHGDLVVDASGRASQLPEWLAMIGRTTVRELVVDARMTYASRFYALPPALMSKWRAAYVQAALPHDPRGGILFPVEANRWHLTLFGYGDAAPPTDETGFLAFADGLRNPILADLLAHGAPLTPIVANRRTENRWRRFDEIGDWPGGLIAAGDSVCCFDPVYGQGMTTGILSALLIQRRFDAEWRGRMAPPRAFARRVQRSMIRVIRPAWNLATGEDLRLPITTGGQLRARDRVLQAYIDRVIAASTADANVRRRLLAVMNMLTGPETLFHPAVLVGVVRHVCGLTPSRPALWPDWPKAAGVAIDAHARVTA